MAMVRFLVCAALLCFFSFSVSAQIYQYRDENGHLRYTDDLTRVAQSKHETVTEMPSVKTMVQTDGLPESGLPLPQPVMDTDVANPAVQHSAQALLQVKDELDETHRSLNEKRTSLQAAKPSDGAPLDELRAFRNRVLEFNAEVEAYQNRQAEFESQATAFNTLVKQSGMRDAQ